MTFQSRLDCGFLETLDETHDHKRSNSISAKNLIYFLSDLENNFKGYTHERFEKAFQCSLKLFKAADKKMNIKTF